MSTLEIRDLVVRYGTGPHPVNAVSAVSLSIGDGSIVGLVGESGSGKSTLAKAVVGLAPIASGEILLDGKLLRSSAHKTRAISRAQLRRLQLVFQDPYASLDPRMAIGESIAEGLTAKGGSRAAKAAEVRRLLELVCLEPDRSSLLPRDLSGGQRQRVAIARALAARPDILIADEITSALDVSVQGAALNLLRDIQRETGIGVLFISHNLAVVRYLAQSIAVMRDGRIVEHGTTAEITERPQHPYTQGLLSAVPRIRSAGTLTADHAV